MKKIFVINPGYDLQVSLEEWKQGKFPGHILYGVNEFEKHGYEAIYPNDSVRYENGRHNRIKFEMNIIRQLMSRRREYELIYIPYLNLGISACLLKKIGVLNKPIVGLVHGIDFSKKKQYSMYFDALTRIIIISEPLYQEFCKEFPGYVNKAQCVPLMPEIKEWDHKEECGYDFASIGKTNRDYSVLLDAIAKTDYKCVMVGTKELADANNEQLEVVDRFVDYGECLGYYRDSYVNVVTMKECGGIFGLTSILDSFTVGKPIIVTKTKYLSVPVEEWGIGIEVPEKDVDALVRAMDKLRKDQVFYNTCRENLRRIAQTYNMDTFARRVCENIDSALGLEKR